jgi:hypothetical protein
VGEPVPRAAWARARAAWAAAHPGLGEEPVELLRAARDIRRAAMYGQR